MIQLDDALQTLEAQLPGPLDVAAAARSIGVSEHHFRRMFATLAGIGLGAYARRRRMTIAAALVRADEPLIEVASRCGYESADAFARAFRDVHGVLPSEARAPDVALTSQPPIRIRITLEGDPVMRHRIESTPDLHLVGRSTRVPLIHHGPNPDIAAFVQSIPVEDTIRLRELNDVAPRGVLAVTSDVEPDAPEGSLLTYLHGVATTQTAPDGFEQVEQPAASWLVMEPEDPSDEALQSLWPHAFTDWFPANPSWQLAPGPSIVAMQRTTDGSGLQRELWIPIQARS